LDSQVQSELNRLKNSGILDYRSEHLPSWCGGCGYFGISHALTQALHSLAIPPENIVIVSGEGCVGRLPFFLKGYGFHTLHGRALPVAAGIKMARPELTVIVVAGDADALGIGIGHLGPTSRRNLDLTYLVFDNGLAALSKGEASVTTPAGAVTSSTPFGNPEIPVNPRLIGLANQASLVGSGYAGQPQQLVSLMARALHHRGFSYVVITSPCPTFDQSHITYDQVRDSWKPIPAAHSPRDLSAAFKLASDGNSYYGVLYEESRPTWEDRMNTIREMAIKAPGGR
jgi:2-oxoglutarate ferredoxin oxidoreductase subunit beta